MISHEFEVLVPEEVLASRRDGILYGYAQQDAKVFNVISCGNEPPQPRSFAPYLVLGELHSCQPDMLSSSKGPLLGFHTDHGVEFLAGLEKCKVSFYSLTQDIFSRNTGILETDLMLDKKVIVSGCGSVGSLLALELARAGVGSFLLIDNDILGYHNICRHQCGVAEVGQFKVSAVRERILNINPKANVVALSSIIERVPKDVFDSWCGAGALILGCADSRVADQYANKISCLYRTPFISIGLWERAFAGEVFWNTPGSETACYLCMTGPESDLLSGRVSANHRVYTTEENLENLSFEPGISIDISFVSNIAAKLALDLLQLGERKARGHVLKSLTQFTLICNTNDPEIGGMQAEIFDHPLQITRSIQIQRRLGCPHCKLVDDQDG